MFMLTNPLYLYSFYFLLARMDGSDKGMPD
jgi:hypothetical protein